MTEKENIMRVVNGQLPEWVPRYNFGPDPLKRAPASAMIGPSLINYVLTSPGTQVDIWGVTFVPVPDAGGGKLPEPNNFILKDIRKWRDVLKAPDISGIDWEAMAKKDYEKAQINRDETAIVMALHIGFFQQLMALMGFNEGLCAMFEEPEEVKALMEYLCDFYTEVQEKCIDYYKPDILNVSDDIAAWRAPFFSVDMYRELIKPYHVRQAAAGRKRGIPIEMHCCGECAEFIDDWRDFGVVLWNPAQVSNDLQAIKKKYGRSFVICGGWDGAASLSGSNCTDEAIKASARAALDKYAKDGGYVFCGGFLGPVGDPEITRKNIVLAEAADSYGRSFYKK